MLSGYLFRIYHRLNRNRKGRRYLIYILVCLVLMAILRQVAFIYRRNYYRSYDVQDWFTRTEACEGNFVGYGHQFVWLRNTELDIRTKQFIVPCSSGIPKYWFYKGYQGTPYEQWLAEMGTVAKIQTSNFRSGITAVVNRKEAHNPYHTFCEFYNIFLLAKHFHWDPKKIDILFMDSRPSSPLDEMWSSLFGGFRRISEISTNEAFRNLVWIPIGYESPMNFHLVRSIPHTEEFRSFVMNSFDVQSQDINCKNLKIVLVLRHDYISHPERLELYGGKIHRKISNEPEVIWSLEKAFPKHTVKAVVLENMSFKDQVELISSTDVFIGMHGAGLAHIMLLPPSACVLELFPYSYRWRAAYYFMSMSMWRNIKHYVWTNPNPDDELEKGFSSRIPPEYISKAMGEIKQHITKNYCSDLTD